jgi:DNA modification methylase
MVKLQIEYWDIERLIPYARNPRKNDDAVPRMAGLIKEFGFKVPIVAKSDGSVIDGHLRLKAAQKLKLKQVPVVLADEWTPAQVKAFRLAVNKSAEWADWDEDLLKLELDELRLEDFDLDLIGFEDVELPEPVQGLTDPDEVPDVPEHPVTRQGDIWLLGNHRLMCGDSTDAGSVALLMAGEKTDMVFTDPPYNVAGESKNFAADLPQQKAYKKLSEADWDKDFDIHPVFERIDENLAKNATVYICTSHFLAPDIWAWMKEWADHYSYCVWSKPNPMPSLAKRHWTWNTEIICYATRGKHVFNFPDEGHCPSTWTITKRAGTYGHPTEKPVAVPEHAIIHSSNREQIILDLFGGSGSTLIACEKTGRVCRMMELSEHYVDVIIRRWQDFTGNVATLEGDGRTFAEVAQERG